MMKNPISIPFNRPAITGHEHKYLYELMEKQKTFSGNQSYTKRCSDWLQEQTQAHRVLLTPSCTAALEMAALLADLGPGDEVIMPSYTFVSTANAFVLRGARPIFVDIDPHTLNIDPQAIEAAITSHTKALCCVHYAGVSCPMTEILEIARQHNLLVIEDAAQGMCASYKKQALGTLGDIGCYSFHETKNYHCGEGGALLINNASLTERAEIMQEKGTNRSQFYRGEVDKYSWVDIGSSYLMSELQAAFLLGQLEGAQEILNDRLTSWNDYHKRLLPLEEKGQLQLPKIPPLCLHNAHMFYILTKDTETRDALLQHLKSQGILAIFHYVPLHSSLKGRSTGCFVGEDRYTTHLSETIIRLPLFFGITEAERTHVIEQVTLFMGEQASSAL